VYFGLGIHPEMGKAFIDLERGWILWWGAILLVRGQKVGGGGVIYGKKERGFHNVGENGFLCTIGPRCGGWGGGGGVGEKG